MDKFEARLKQRRKNEFRFEILNQKKCCQKCHKPGNQIRLKCHYIHSVKKYPELEFNPDNVVVLCVDCGAKQLTLNLDL